MCISPKNSDLSFNPTFPMIILQRATVGCNGNSLLCIIILNGPCPVFVNLC